MTTERSGDACAERFCQQARPSSHPEGVGTVIRLRVYQVTPEGEGDTIVEPFEYEGDAVAIQAMELPPCECPRCRDRTERAAS